MALSYPQGWKMTLFLDKQTRRALYLAAAAHLIHHYRWTNGKPGRRHSGTHLQATVTFFMLVCPQNAQWPGCLVTEDSLFSQCSWNYLFISVKHDQQMVDFIWSCFTHSFLPNDVCVQLYWLIRLVFQVSNFLQVRGNRLLIAWGEMKNGHLLCSRNTSLQLHPSLPPAVFLSTDFHNDEVSMDANFWICLQPSLTEKELEMLFVQMYEDQWSLVIFFCLFFWWVN